MTIGLINTFVPLLPTTLFLIIGVWAYGKGSPELRQQLLNHPRFGASLRNWMEHRAMTKLAKLHCLVAIALGYALTLGMRGVTAFTVILGVGLATLMIYLGTRPEPHGSTSASPVSASSLDAQADT